MQQQAVKQQSTAGKSVPVFPSDYEGARQAFRQACTRAGFAHFPCLNEAASNQQIALTCDVAITGPPRPAATLFVACATHGAEGPAGSALMQAWLEQLATVEARLTVRIVLLHALNPWGFHHRCRGTEHNVDINRNFVSFPTSIRNDGYSQYHDQLLPAVWTEQTRAQTLKLIAALQSDANDSEAMNTLRAGQYTHPDGILYGGAAPSWSRRLFETLVTTLAAGTAACFIDLHTGVGAPGEVVVLTFHPDGSAANARAHRWWGDACLRAQADPGSKVRYNGMIFDAFPRLLPEFETTVGCIEFGTTGFEGVQLGLIADCWRRQRPERHDDPLALADIQQAFNPDDDSWQHGVLAQGVPLLNATLAGLAAESRAT